MKLWAGILTSMLMLGSVQVAAPIMETAQAQEYQVSVTNQIFPSTVTLDTWEWNSQRMHETGFVQELKDNRIKRIFINAGYEPAIQGSALVKQPEAFSSFIQQTNAAGIQVQALYSNTEWAYASKYTSMATELRQVFSYNRLHPKTKIQAIHLDIEPYLLPEWETNKKQVMTEYLGNLQKLRSEVNSHNKKQKDTLKVVVDLPNWMINETLNGTSFVKQVFAYVDEISIMNYTVYADWYKDAGLQYLKIAQPLGKKVSIGSEFQPDFADVTLYNKSVEELQNYFQPAITSFQAYSGFNGIALHTLETYESYTVKNAGY